MAQAEFRRWLRVVSAITIAFLIRTSAGVAADGTDAPARLPRWRDTTGMVFLPGGTMTYRGKPVRIDSFYIDRCEVTNEQYCRFLNDGQADHWNAQQQIERQGDRFVPIEDRERWPVTAVTWFDAAAYARWSGKQLPTDAQWLWAAAGAEHRKYAWGNEPITPERANYGGRLGHPQPVGSHPQGRSPQGVDDLTGNVAEWCRDWFDPQYVPESRNPGGPAGGSRKIRRAACYGMDAKDQTNAEFAGPAPDYHPACIGFRCVRPARRVMILLGENFAELELASYTAVLSWAAHTNTAGNYMVPKQDATPVPWIDVAIVGFDDEVHGMGGTTIRPQLQADQLSDEVIRQFDAVAVPACVGSGRGQHTYRGWENISSKRAAHILQQVHQRGGVISTMCAGRCALKAAGLPAPKTDATHPLAFDPQQRTATSMGPAVGVEAACLLLQQLISPAEYRSFRKFNPWLFGGQDQFPPRVETLR